jgi:hypothetical protein
MAKTCKSERRRLWLQPLYFSCPSRRAASAGKGARNGTLLGSLILMVAYSGRRGASQNVAPQISLRTLRKFHAWGTPR